MARTTITAAQTDARSPINQTLMDALRNNDSDHEDRLLVQEAYGTNWASQLGTALTDTNMGSIVGDALPDNSSSSALFNEISKHLVFPRTALYSSSAEIIRSTGPWASLGSSFTFTAYKSFFCKCLLRCKIDADTTEYFGHRLRLKISSIGHATKYLYAVNGGTKTGPSYILNSVFATLNDTGAIPTSDYTTIYNVWFILEGSSAGLTANSYGGGVDIHGVTSIGATFTVQPEWQTSDVLQIKEREYYFFAS